MSIMFYIHLCDMVFNLKTQDILLMRFRPSKVMLLGWQASCFLTNKVNTEAKTEKNGFHPLPHTLLLNSMNSFSVLDKHKGSFINGLKSCLHRISKCILNLCHNKPVVV